MFYSAMLYNTILDYNLLCCTVLQVNMGTTMRAVSCEFVEKTRSCVWARARNTQEKGCPPQASIRCRGRPAALVIQQRCNYMLRSFCGEADSRSSRLVDICYDIQYPPIPPACENTVIYTIGGGLECGTHTHQEHPHQAYEDGFRWM